MHRLNPDRDEKVPAGGRSEGENKASGTDHSSARFHGFVNGVHPMKKFILLAATALVLSAATVPASAQQRVKVGTLTCDISGGIGMIIASQKTMTCGFLP